MQRKYVENEQQHGKPKSTKIDSKWNENVIQYESAANLTVG